MSDNDSDSDSTRHRRERAKDTERRREVGAVGCVDAWMSEWMNERERERRSEGLRSTVNPVEGLKRDKGVSFCDRSETATAPAKPLALPPRPPVALQ